MSVNRFVKAHAVALSLLVLALIALGVSVSTPPRRGRMEQTSPVVLDRKGAWLRALPTEQGRWRIRANLERIDPVFLRRVVALEDARFYWHPGVDPVAAVRAAIGDLIARRVRSGGSTLTMQLARLLEPHPRTFTAKLTQAARALRLDARLGKRGVLADYLTLAPYGGNLEGVRAASLAWFGHEPDHLTDAEQALLIALPQAPEARRPDRHPAAAKAARARILAKLERAGLITPEGRLFADAEPLPRRTPLPALAWHASGQIARTAVPGHPEVLSTLDAPLQVRMEVLARQTAEAQGATSSAAVLVVEVNSRAVRAAVGSSGLDRPGGWVDATRALRSPGSALKPFIYAMAFDSGIAAPDTKVDDAPVTYAGYRPHDFDHTFHGEVTARQALQMSLNVPAVHVLAALGPSVFEERLRAAGVPVQRPKSALAGPSLALALGGEGVRLRDVATLYAALADHGVVKPLAWTEADAALRRKSAGARLIRADAAEQVLDILQQTPPPAGRAAPSLGGAARLAFKTGTSYGYRDAVAAGVGGGFVVVVWTGRPDGGARPRMTGREAALPLLFDIFDLLPSAPRPLSPDKLSVAPDAMQQMAKTNEGSIRLLFPPDGARLQVDEFGPKAAGLPLSAQGRNVHWYVDGSPIVSDAATGQALWRPPAPGFYLLVATDGLGRAARAHVRVDR